MREAARKAIAKHLAKHGPEKWHLVRGKFPDVADSTWWRWVREVREAPPSREALGIARKKMAATVRGEPDKAAALSAGLPAMPSPAAFARNGGQAVAALDFFKASAGLFEDAEKLRAYSLNADGGIKIPMFFEKSIKSRLDILDKAAGLLERIYSIQEQQRLFDTIIAFVAEEEPSVQKRLIDKLHAAKSQIGATYF